MLVYNRLTDYELHTTQILEKEEVIVLLHSEEVNMF